MTMMQSEPVIVVRVNAADAAGVVAKRVDGARPARWPDGFRIGPKGTFWWIIGLAVCMAWDRAVWLLVSASGKARLEWLERWLSWSGFVERLRGVQLVEALGTVLYAGAYGFGRLWLWVVVAIAVLGRDWLKSDTEKVRHGMRRAVFVFASPAAAGLAAELLKFIVRRMRPEHADGFYRFKSAGEHGWSIWSVHFWDGAGLGMASSHAAVAIGGALAAGVLWPRLRWWLMGAALITCVSRVAVGAHFVSDVYVGATLGVLACAAFYAWDRRNHGGLGLAGGGGGGVERA